MAYKKILLAKCSLHSNKENAYQHLIDLFGKREIRVVKKKKKKKKKKARSAPVRETMKNVADGPMTARYRSIKTC